MKLLKTILLFASIIIITTGCSDHAPARLSPDKRIVKKFYLRLSAREPAKASEYLYPDDHVNLYIFNRRFLKGNETIGFQILELTKTIVDNQPAIIVKIMVHNNTTQLNDYFMNLGIIDNNIITDTVVVKRVQDQRKITFKWGWNDIMETDDLALATVNTESGVLNIRSGPGENYKVIDQASKGFDENLLIDNSFQNPNWRKCLFINEDGSIESAYVSSIYTNVNNIYFINLGWVGKIGGLLATVIALVVLIVVFPLMITTIFRAAEDNATFGIILFGVLVGIIIFVYALIESVLFNLFFINLPF
ncbi:hypothetical protein ACFLT1_02630 [Bacteroidota bacterium]